MITAPPNLSDAEARWVLQGFQQACGGCPPTRADGLGGFMCSLAPIRPCPDRKLAGPRGDSRENPPESPASGERAELLGAGGHRNGKPYRCGWPPSKPSPGLCLSPLEAKPGAVPVPPQSQAWGCVCPPQSQAQGCVCPPHKAKPRAVSVPPQRPASGCLLEVSASSLASFSVSPAQRCIVEVSTRKK